MTILEAHKVNKLSFEVPPSLEKAFKEQQDKELVCFGHRNGLMKTLCI